MHKHMFILLLFGSITPWQAMAATNTITVTLKEAITMAEQHPRLQLATLGNDAARASMSAQSSYAYNPELSLEAQNRKAINGNQNTDYYIGISQGIEIGGKGSYRQQTSQAALDVSIQQRELLYQQLIFDAASALVALHQAQQTLSIRQQQSKTLQTLSQGVQKQLDAGDANILQRNLAQAAYASALSALNQAKRDYISQRNQFAQVTAWFSGDNITPKLPRLDLQWQPPTNMYELAMQARPERAILLAQSQQSQASAKLANANRYLDPTLSLMTGEEAGERLLKLGISIPLPFTNSNKGKYQASLAQVEQAQGQLAWFDKHLALDIAAAKQHHQGSMAMLQTFVQQGEHSDSIALAKIAFEAGELSLEALVFHINQALDAKLTAINLQQQAWLSRINLAQTLGHPEYILQGIKP